MSISQDALLVLLPLYVLDLGMSPAFAALVIGIRGIGILAFDVPAGQLVMRYGERVVLTIGLLAACSGFLIIAMSGAEASLAAAAVLFGIGFASWMLGRQSYIAACCAPEETGRAIAVMAGIQRGGALLGPLLGGVVAQYASFSAAFVLCAVLALVAGIVVLLYTKEVAETESGEGGDGSLAATVREHRGVFATAGFAAMMLQLMRATRRLLVPLFGQAVGLDVATIGAIYALSAAIDMCLFYPVGVLVDRRGRRWSAIPAMVLFAIGLALLPLADDRASLLAVALLLGFANGCGSGIVMIMGADLSRRAVSRGSFLSVWRLMADGGTSTAPLLTSFVISVAGLAAASTIVAALGAAGAAVMITLVAETNRAQ